MAELIVLSHNPDICVRDGAECGDGPCPGEAEHRTCLLCRAQHRLRSQIMQIRCLPSTSCAVLTTCAPLTSHAGGTAQCGVCYDTTVQCCGNATLSMVGGFFNGGCYAKPYCNLRYNTGTMNVSIVGEGQRPALGVGGLFSGA